MNPSLDIRVDLAGSRIESSVGTSSSLTGIISLSHFGMIPVCDRPIYIAGTSYKLPVLPLLANLFPTGAKAPPRQKDAIIATIRSPRLQNRTRTLIFESAEYK